MSRGWTRGLTRRERFGWSVATGLLVQAAVLVVLLAFRTRPDAVRILLGEAAVALTGVVLSRRGGRATGAPGPTPAREKAAAVLLAAIAAAAWLVFLAGTLADGMFATDYLAFWGYKGKIVFLTGGVPMRLFRDPALYFAHREYPLLVSLTLAALAFFLGSWNDQALALLYPFAALATFLAISGFLGRRVSRLAGATAAALASLCVFLYRPANAGTAEVPFALGLVLASSAAIEALESGAASVTARLVLASLFCASLKQEGSLFVFLLAAVLALRLRGRARLVSCAALVLPPSLHWIALYLLRGNQTRRDFDFTLFEPRRWAELPALFSQVVGRFLSIGAHEAFVPLCAVAVYLLVTKRGIADALLPVFLAQVLFYAVAFSVSSFDPMYAIDGAFRRIAMSLFPAFTLVLCARQVSPAGVASPGSIEDQGVPAWAHQSSEPEATPDAGESSGLPSRRAAGPQGLGMTGKSR